jgi:hypothetical protein
MTLQQLSDDIPHAHGITRILDVTQVSTAMRPQQAHNPTRSRLMVLIRPDYPLMTLQLKVQAINVPWCTITPCRAATHLAQAFPWKPQTCLRSQTWQSVPCDVWTPSAPGITTPTRTCQQPGMREPMFTHTADACTS